MFHGLISKASRVEPGFHDGGRGDGLGVGVGVLVQARGSYGGL